MHLKNSSYLVSLFFGYEYEAVVSSLGFLSGHGRAPTISALFFGYEYEAVVSSIRFLSGHGRTPINSA